MNIRVYSSRRAPIFDLSDHRILRETLSNELCSYTVASTSGYTCIYKVACACIAIDTSNWCIVIQCTCTMYVPRMFAYSTSKKKHSFSGISFFCQAGCTVLTSRQEKGYSKAGQFLTFLLTQQVPLPPIPFPWCAVHMNASVQDNKILYCAPTCASSLVVNCSVGWLRRCTGEYARFCWSTATVWQN